MSATSRDVTVVAVAVVGLAGLAGGAYFAIHSRSEKNLADSRRDQVGSGGCVGVGAGVVDGLGYELLSGARTTLGPLTRRSRHAMNLDE